MPFLPEGTQEGSTKGIMRVAPDQVLQLKHDLQSIHDEIHIFMQNYSQSMVMRPLGADPVSHETADAFNANTQAALDAAWGYLDALKRVLAQLDHAAKTYNLVEDTNAHTFRQDVQ